MLSKPKDAAGWHFDFRKEKDFRETGEKRKRENYFQGHPSLKEKANKWDINRFHENKTYKANTFIQSLSW